MIQVEALIVAQGVTPRIVPTGCPSVEAAGILSSYAQYDPAKMIQVAALFLTIEAPDVILMPK